MPCSISTSVATPHDHGLPLCALIRAFSVIGIRKRMALRSIRALWNAMLSMVNQVPEGNPRLENESRTVELSTLHTKRSLR